MRKDPVIKLAEHVNKVTDQVNAAFRDTAKGIRVLDEHIRELAERVVRLEEENRELKAQVAALFEITRDED